MIATAAREVRSPFSCLKSPWIRFRDIALGDSVPFFECPSSMLSDCSPADRQGLSYEPLLPESCRSVVYLPAEINQPQHGRVLGMELRHLRSYQEPRGRRFSRYLHVAS